MAMCLQELYKPFKRLFLKGIFQGGLIQLYKSEIQARIIALKCAIKQGKYKGSITISPNIYKGFKGHLKRQKQKGNCQDKLLTIYKSIFRQK